VVLAQIGVTGETQPAIRHEASHGRFTMTSVARLVRVQRIGMRRADCVVRMTRRAIALCGVMIVVTGATRLYRRRWIECDRRLVTGRALQLGMGAVRK